MQVHDVSGNGWDAEVLISNEPNEAGFWHVQGRVMGDTNTAALAGATQIIHSYADGKLTYVRAKPEAMSEVDFDTKKVLHRGYVRFSFKNEPGEWMYPDVSMKIPSIGEALDGRS
jgi:hypothetical protein